MAAAISMCGLLALDISMVTGPISVAFKVKGVSLLVFMLLVVANIFTGKITLWNDLGIAAHNSGASLPLEKVTVFFCFNSLGTMHNFEKYLNMTPEHD